MKKHFHGYTIHSSPEFYLCYGSPPYKVNPSATLMNDDSFGHFRLSLSFGIFHL
jgi:hypothetical protein